MTEIAAINYFISKQDKAHCNKYHCYTVFVETTYRISVSVWKNVDKDLELADCVSEIENRGTQLMESIYTGLL